MIAEMSFYSDGKYYEYNGGNVSIMSNNFGYPFLNYNIQSCSALNKGDDFVSFVIKDKSMAKNTEFQPQNQTNQFFWNLSFKNPNEKIYEAIDGVVNLYLDGELSDNKGKNIIVSGTFDVTCVSGLDTIKLTNGSFKFKNGKGAEQQVINVGYAYK
ncbi:MAG: hypothetical protein LBS50_04800 [Prevotellaceae bacterium]|nr:hypothetical protein [Prevotellaceae bacterium]